MNKERRTPKFDFEKSKLVKNSAGFPRRLKGKKLVDRLIKVLCFVANLLTNLGSFAHLHNGL